MQLVSRVGGIGKATTNYTGRSEGLKITVNAGQTINLVSGPSDFDALSRLGIAAGVLMAGGAALWWWRRR